MIIKCTDEQVKQMAAAAINSSRPMGLGFLHYQENTRTKPEELEIIHNSLYIDYYKGRMVKFYARKAGENVWDFTPDEPRSDYQSWVGNYPTYQDLFNAIS